MQPDLTTLQRRLTSENKQVRLRTLKLILRHPDARPIDLARCLCSEDIRNFEFLKVFELHDAMRESWPRLHGVGDAGVYRYLSELYRSDPEKHLASVVHILELLCTRKALDMLERLRESVPERPEHARKWIDDARGIISYKLRSNDS
jgi:hypothetical protein